jgi:cupin 2 domain-containing protein
MSKAVCEGLDAGNASHGNRNVGQMITNLFTNLPTDLPEEFVTILAENQHVRIERIVSTGQCSPKGHWYDQEKHEWVVVLQGEAKLLFEGDNQPLHMKPGDFINIPAHRKHRVEWTTPDGPTVWLAVFH